MHETNRNHYYDMVTRRRVYQGISQSLSYEERDCNFNDSRFTDEDNVPYNKVQRLGWVNPITDIDFSKDNMHCLKREAMRLYKKYSSFHGMVKDELKKMVEPLRSAFHSFIVDIATYEQHVKYKTISPKYLFFSSIEQGPAFASWLSGFKDFALARKTFRHFLEHASEYEEYKEFCYIVDDVPNEEFSLDSLFRVNSLFAWTPPTLDLREYSLVEPDQTLSYLKNFRFHARRVLSKIPSNLFDPTPLKSVIRDTTTSCREGPTWKVTHEDPAEVRGVSHIANIPRERKQQRAACVEEYSSALRIRWINKSLAKFISLDMRSAQKYDRAQLGERLSRQMRKGKEPISMDILNPIIKDSSAKNKLMCTSYCRDFSKEGLTKPMNITQIMMEELHKHFPSEEAFFITGFFNEWKFIYEDKEYAAKRGHGLGMGNELTTFMQLIIESMVLSTVRDKGQRIKPKASYYLNDDAAMIFHSWSNACIYRHHDRRICKHLGLAFKDKASFISIGSIVICEVYSSCYHPKIDQRPLFDKLAFFNILKSNNCAHAKNSYNSMTFRNVTESDIRIIREYWGCLLHKNEHGYCAFTGGWNPMVKETIRTDFVRMHAGETLSVQESAAFKALNMTKLIFKPWIRDFEGHKQKISLFYNEEFCELMGMDESLTPQNMFRPSVNPEENNRAWRSYERSLINNFQKLHKGGNRVTVGDVYDHVVKQHASLDILPPQGFRTVLTSMELCKPKTLVSKNPYGALSANNYYSSFLAEGEKRIKYLVSVDTRSEISSAVLTDKDRSKMNWKFLDEGNLHGTSPICYERFSMPNPEAFKYYHNPFKVQMCCEEMGFDYSVLLPLSIPDVKQEMLDQRKDTYGWLTPHEWLDIGMLPSPCRIMLILAPIWVLGQEVRKDALISTLLEKPMLGVTCDPLIYSRLTDKKLVTLYFQQKYRAIELLKKIHPSWGNDDPEEEDNSEGTTRYNESDFTPLEPNFSATYKDCTDAKASAEEAFQGMFSSSDEEGSDYEYDSEESR